MTRLRPYSVAFECRAIGALGVFAWVWREVRATTREAAAREVATALRLRYETRGGPIIADHSNAESPRYV